MSCALCEHVVQILGQDQCIEPGIDLDQTRCTHLRHTRIRDGIELQPGLSQEGFRLPFRDPNNLPFLDPKDFTFSLAFGPTFSPTLLQS